MRRLVVAPQAERDLDDILAWSEALFGAAAVERYRRLLDGAIADLLANPARTGVRTAPGLSPSIRLYALRSAGRGSPPAERVSRPRHVIAFSSTDAELRIVRVLHDRMQVANHVTPG